MFEYGPKFNFFLETPYLSSDKKTKSKEFEGWHWFWLDPASTGEGTDTVYDNGL